METKKQFKPYDRVLVKDAYGKWRCDIYSHYDKDENSHWVIGFGWMLDNDILPYEGNEHLVGTTDEPEEVIELMEGEWVMASDSLEGIKRMYCTSSKFEKIDGNLFIVNLRNCSMGYMYAIRLSDFNPNDMEEARKHILCVKNGKIIRYKG